MLIAVDPDTGTIKDFASSAVTTDMTVGANVTTGSQTWDGNTRSFFKLGAGTAAADFIAFGTNKPSWTNNVASTQRTWVWIGEVGTGAPRAFGSNSTHYMAAQNTGTGGATCPIQMGAGFSTNLNGGQSLWASGTKLIFGASTTHTGGAGAAVLYWALHNDSAMSSASGTGPTSNSAVNNFDLTHIGRRNDSTGKGSEKIHLIAIFNTALTEAQWDSLRDDWFGTLLEVVSGGAVEGDLTATEAADVSAITGDVIITGTIAATEAADVANFNGGSTPNTGTLAGTEAQDVAAASGTVRNPRLTIGPLKNNTGTLLADETGATVYVYQTSGAHVVTKTSQTSDGSGVMTVTDAALVSGTTYRYVIVLGSGAEGMDKSAAA